MKKHARKNKELNDAMIQYIEENGLTYTILDDIREVVKYYKSIRKQFPRRKDL
jgi:hypothetical protein